MMEDEENERSILLKRKVIVKGLDGKGVINQGEKDKGEKKEEGKASLLSGFFNLTNSMVGGGILAFPYAFYSTGLLSGIILVVIFVSFSSYSLHIMFMAARLAPKKFRSYQDVMNHYCGGVMMKVCEVTIFVYNSGACIVFLTIIGDSITPVFQWIFNTTDGFFVNRQFIILLFSGLFVFPVILLRKVEFLSYTSFLSIVSVSYVVGMVITSSLILLFTEGVPEGVTDHLFLNTNLFADIFPQFFMALPVVAFAFNCHVITVPIYNELYKPTQLRLDLIVLMTIALVVTGYSLTGIFGFLQFGDATDPDILKSFYDGAIHALIGRVTMALVATFSYPVLFFTARLSINTIFLKDKEMDSFTYVLVTSSIFIVILTISMVVSDISIVFGFVAAVCGVCLAVVFPAVIYLRMLWLGRKGKSWAYYLWFIVPCLYFTIGSFMIVLGPLTTIFKILDPNAL